MGTPEFSEGSFRKIIASTHEIVACYTQPPRPASRGMQVKESPIHILARRHEVPVFTPENFKHAEDVEEFRNIKADIAVVAAYGLLLPVDILNGTKFGCINIHPSLLPRWRGAAPIHRPIIAGDKETGCCIMQMDAGLDTGDIILQRRIPIPARATTSDMHDVLAALGADMIVEALDLIEAGKATFTKQSSEGVTYAKKITKEEALIDFNNKASDIVNLIHGLNPYPGAYFEYNKTRIKILEADKVIKSHHYNNGEVVNNSMRIACADGFIVPYIVQAEGKKKMKVEEFMKGFKL
jgi:methionyl-tRNA formyltransferase